MDLLRKHHKLTHKEQVLDFITSCSKPIFRHEVILWGTKNFCNDADRHKNKLIQDGLVIRIPVHDVYPAYKGAEEYVYQAAVRGER